MVIAKNAKKNKSDLPFLFKKHVLKKHCFKSNDKLLLALSGGIDSVVLFHLLYHLSKEINFELQVMHFNHGLRGDESDEDLLFVKELAKSFKLKFWTVSLKNKLKKQSGNLQAQARSLRYELLIKKALQQKLNYILTAHQASDVFETFLIQTLRAKGPDSWFGLKEQSLIKDTQIKLVRPLLPFSRNKILEYAKENKILWREDSSNLKTHYLRNFIRHKVLKGLLKINQNFEELFFYNLSLWQDEIDYFRQNDERIFKLICKQSKKANECRLSKSKLSQLPTGMRYRIYKKCMENIGLNVEKVKRVYLEEVDALLFSPNSKARITLAQGVGVFPYKEFICFMKGNDKGKGLKSKFF